jgi:hypothetical protein
MKLGMQIIKSQAHVDISEIIYLKLAKELPTLNDSRQRLDLFQ